MMRMPALCLGFAEHFNLSEMKLPPESDIYFFGNPYSTKITLHVNIRLSVDKSSNLLVTGNLL